MCLYHTTSLSVTLFMKSDMLPFLNRDLNSSMCFESKEAIRKFACKHTVMLKYISCTNKVYSQIKVHKNKTGPSKMSETSNN